MGLLYVSREELKDSDGHQVSLVTSLDMVGARVIHEIAR